MLVTRVTNYYKIISYKKRITIWFNKILVLLLLWARMCSMFFKKKNPIRLPILENSDFKLLEFFTNKSIESAVSREDNTMKYKEISEKYKLFQTWEIGYPDSNGLSAEPHIQNQRYTKQLLQYYFIQKKGIAIYLV